MPTNQYNNYQSSGNERQIHKDSYETIKEGKEANDVSVVSFQKLRKNLGYLGILLPILLAVLSFNFTLEGRILPSISDYFHSPLRVVFIGIVTAIAIFLFSYTGEDKKKGLFSEDTLCSIAGFFALGILIFPTYTEKPYLTYSKATKGYDRYILDNFDFKWIGSIHLGCAFLFFLLLAYIVGCKFRLKEPSNTKEGKLYRKLYAFFSIGMIVCLGAIYVCWELPNSETWFFPSTFLFEAIALFLFGSAWLLKGHSQQNLINDYDRVSRSLFSSNEENNDDKI